MAGNYQQQGQDWYNQRLNTIASMMSMHNADPSYLLGALIGNNLSTPFQTWIDNKVLPTIMGKKKNNPTDPAPIDPQTKTTVDFYNQQTLPTYNNIGDAANSAQLNNIANSMGAAQDMNLLKMGQNAGQTQPPTQAEVNANNNNITDAAVTQAAQNEGNMGGAMNGLLSNSGLNQAVQFFSNPSSFSSALSQRNGSEGGEGYNGRTIEQMIYQQIIDSKNKYADAQAKGDEQGMQDAMAQANNARSLAKVYQVPLVGAGSGSTLEQAQQQMNRLENDGSTTEDDVRNGFRQGIISAKQAYTEAQAKGDKEGMTRAQNTAETIRRMAEANGVDLPEGGADVTANDLALIIQRDAAKQAQAAEEKESERLRNLTPQELLQRPEVNVSPNDFYQRAYAENISNGIPEYRARRKAADTAMQYESSYMRDLSRNMETGGINEDGSLNQAGMALLNRAILANNPEMAQMYMNGFASPRDVWGSNIDFQKAAVQQQYNQILNAQKAQAASALQNQKFQQNWQSDEHKAGLQYNAKVALAKLEHQLKGQDEVTKAQARIQLAQSLGLDPNSEDTRNYILTGRIGGGSSRGGSNGSSGSGSSKMPSWVGKFNAQYEKARASLDGDDVNELENIFNEHKLEDFNQDAKDLMLSQIMAIKGLRQKNIGDDDGAAEIWSGIPPYYREKVLPGYDFSGY